MRIHRGVSKVLKNVLLDVEGKLWRLNFFFLHCFWFRGRFGGWFWVSR